MSAAFTFAFRLHNKQAASGIGLTTCSGGLRTVSVLLAADAATRRQLDSRSRQPPELDARQSLSVAQLLIPVAELLLISQLIG